jgi:hypothetical protein
VRVEEGEKGRKGEGIYLLPIATALLLPISPSPLLPFSGPRLPLALSLCPLLFALYNERG